MLVIHERAPQPDMRVWPGRRVLAFVDAAAWPVTLAYVLHALPVPLGVVGQCLLAYCGFAGLRRVYLAVAVNHHYRFTTWRWGCRILPVLIFGYALKVAALLTV